MSEHQLVSQSFDEYAKADGVSASMLDQIRKSPAHLRAYMDGTLREEGDALALGTLIHLAVLQPDTMQGAVWVKPEGVSLATKEGRAWKEEHQGRPIISQDEYNTVVRCRDAVLSNQMARSLLSKGFAEQSLYVEDSHGTLRKSRFDYISTSGSAIPDLKTCRSASPESFEKAILNYSYHIRAAFYVDNANLAGMEKDSFVFICIETQPPYLVACYQLSGYVLSAGRVFYQRDLQLYRNCMESGKWPGYHEGLREIGLPEYAMRKLEEIA